MLSRLTYSLIPSLNFKEFRVLRINIEIVIGPTPPGTGVIQPATSLAASKSTSPFRRAIRRPVFLLIFQPTRFTPTSITQAPGSSHSGPVNHLNYSRWRTRWKFYFFSSNKKPAHINGMESINIFVRINGVDYFLLVNMFW